MPKSYAGRVTAGKGAAMPTTIPTPSDLRKLELRIEARLAAHEVRIDDLEARVALLSFPPVDVEIPNAAPNGVALPGDPIPANIAAGELVSQIVIDDPDDTSWTVTIDNTKFTVAGSPGSTPTLLRSASGSLTSNSTETVNVTVTDGSDNEKTFEVTVTVLSTPDVSVNDPASVEEGSNVTFRVSLTEATDETVRVTYATGDGGAITGLDYTGISGTADITAGNTFVDLPVVATLDDVAYRGTRTFSMNITAAVYDPGGAAIDLTIVDAVGIGTITDDESPPAGVTVGTRTLKNDGASQVPDPWFKTFGMTFEEGDVTSAQRVRVEQSDGTVVAAQFDNRLYWADGSLRFAVVRARIAGASFRLAAGAALQLVFKTETGAFDNSTSAGLSDITSGSDFKVELTGLHEQYVENSPMCAVGIISGVRCSGGAVTSGFMRRASGSNNSALAYGGRRFLTASIRSNTGGTGAVVKIQQKFRGLGFVTPGLQAGSAGVQIVHNGKGSGYAANDTVTLPGGAVFTVSTVSGGAVESGRLTVAGTYDDEPARRRGTLAANAFAATASSNIVTVTDVGHGASVGECVSFDGNSQYGAGSVGGLALTAGWKIASIIDADHYTFTHSSVATSTAVGGVSGAQAVYWQLTQTATSGAGTGLLVYPSIIGNAGQGGGGGAWIPTGTVTVTQGGSGYSNKGSGTWTIEANDILVDRIGGGSVCDVFEGWGKFKDGVTESEHLNAWVWVERWKNANGTVANYRVNFTPANGVIRTAAVPMPVNTYDATLKDGSTTIASWTNCLALIAQKWNTVDADGKPYWRTNHAAMTGVEPVLTGTEAAAFRRSKFIPPYDSNLTITLADPPTTSEDGHPQPYVKLASYFPMFCGPLEYAIGTAGNRSTIGPFVGIDGVHFLTQKTVWLKQARMASLAMFSLVGGPPDGTTGRPPNATTTAFTGFTSWPTQHWLGPNSRYVLGAGVAGAANGTDKGWGDIGMGSALYLGSDHTPQPNAYMYLLDGDQHHLRSLIAEAGHYIFLVATDSRNVSANGTSYQGIVVGRFARDGAWSERDIALASALCPTSMVEYTYFDTILRRNLAFRLGKQIELGWDTLGVWTNPTKSNGRYLDTSTNFMSQYIAQSACFMAALRPDIADATTWRDSFKKYIVGLWTNSSCYYMADAYYSLILKNTLTGAAIDTLELGDPTNPGPAASPGTELPGCTASFTSGVSTITWNLAVRADQQNRIPVDTGARIRFSPTNTGLGTANVANHPPANVGESWYWYKKLTATTGEIYTDQALTSIVTPSESKTIVNSWIVAAGSCPVASLGTDNGGTSTSPQGRMAVIRGTLKWYAAASPGGSPNPTTALANHNAIWSALAGNTTTYNGDPDFGFGDTY
jgi:hypothetical protein